MFTLQSKRVHLVFCRKTHRFSFMKYLTNIARGLGVGVRVGGKSKIMAIDMTLCKGMPRKGYFFINFLFEIFYFEIL